MRRYSTVIAIAIAAVLAAVIVIASSARHDLGDGSARPASDASALPAGAPQHRA